MSITRNIENSYGIITEIINRWYYHYYVYILQETFKYTYVNKNRLFFNLAKYNRKISEAKFYIIQSVLSTIKKQIMDDDSDPCSVAHNATRF